ncbi:MAG: LytTR family DNA-binding domain-containing protein, partial [Clostridium sp.]|nr:LytTR family DNA-binding domain-containing protein [Clostridium sp.]
CYNCAKTQPSQTVTMQISIKKAKDKTMFIGICDDEVECVEAVKECCERAGDELGEKFEYLIFHTGEELLTYNKEIDILFLDIEMDGINGIDAMQILEKRDYIRNIFFVSAHSDYVFDSFGSKTRGFFCKPLEYDQFTKKIKKLIDKQLNKSKEIIEISLSEKHIYLFVGQIVYLSGKGNYVCIVTNRESYTVCGSLKAWEKKLAGYNFFRIHKSYLVNLSYVLNIGKYVRLKSSNINLPIGRKYKQTSQYTYREYLLNIFRENIDD